MDVMLDGDSLRVTAVPEEEMLQVIEIAAAAGLREVMTIPRSHSTVEIVITRPRGGDVRQALVPMIMLAAALEQEDPAHWLKSWQMDHAEFNSLLSRL